MYITYYDPFSVAYVYMCLGLTSWEQITYEGPHLCRRWILPLSVAIDCLELLI